VSLAGPGVRGAPRHPRLARGALRSHLSHPFGGASLRAVLARSAISMLLCVLGCKGARELSVAPQDLANWQTRAEQLRGLRFERPVQLVRVEARRIPELMRAQIALAFPPEKARAYAQAYAAIGLLPAGLDLFEMLVGFYSDQLAGLYDPHDHRLYVRSGESPGGYPLQVVAVHELVHALQHQHFPRAIAGEFGLEHNDDLSTMLSVVLEGDASFAAFGFSPSHERAPAAIEPVRNAMMGEIDRDGGVYARAPRPLRLRLVAPYADGLLLAARIYAQGGNAALDAWVEDPPLSTLPLLDTRAAARPVEFVRLPLDWLQRELGERECRLGHHDVVGPLMIGALFHERGAAADAAVAASWAGDRLVHAACRTGSEFFWLTRWSTAEEAARFASLYLQIAPAVAKFAGLASVPTVSVSDRTAVVRTPVFAALGPALETKLELRAYSSFGAWFAEGCFPEDRCPALL
jgi:hypothetical protein